jgi:hypothetical protein
MTTLGERMFYNCSALESVVIPKSIASIGYEAFQNCSGLRSVTLESGLVIIGEEMFGDCTSLESVTIPATIKDVGFFAFSRCTSLSQVTLEDGLTTIGDYMFYGTSLTEIVFPESLETVGYMAFIECKSLTSVTVLSETATFRDAVFNSSRMELEGVIYGFGGSTAQTYAEDNHITFVPIYKVHFQPCNEEKETWDYGIAGETVAEPAEPTNPSRIFTGWYETSDWSTEPVSFPYVISGTTTLYAGWVELDFATSETDNAIDVGGSVVLTPNVDGGTWTFDEDILSRDGNTFTGLKAGSTTVTYTVDDQSVELVITVQDPAPPATGQNAVDNSLLIAMAAAAGIIAFASRPRRRAENGSLPEDLQ